MKEPLTQHLQTPLPVPNFLITTVFFPHFYIYLHSVGKEINKQRWIQVPCMSHFKYSFSSSVIKKAPPPHSDNLHTHSWTSKLPSWQWLERCLPSLPENTRGSVTAPHSAIPCSDWRRNSPANRVNDSHQPWFPTRAAEVKQRLTAQPHNVHYFIREVTQSARSVLMLIQLHSSKGKTFACQSPLTCFTFSCYKQTRLQPVEVQLGKVHSRGVSGVRVSRGTSNSGKNIILGVRSYSGIYNSFLFLMIPCTTFTWEISPWPHEQSQSNLTRRRHKVAEKKHL